MQYSNKPKSWPWRESSPASDTNDFLNLSIGFEPCSIQMVFRSLYLIWKKKILKQSQHSTLVFHISTFDNSRKLYNWNQSLARHFLRQRPKRPPKVGQAQSIRHGLTDRREPVKAATHLSFETSEVGDAKRKITPSRKNVEKIRIICN